MKALLIGYGSIGKRHASILLELDFKVHIITRYPEEVSSYKFYHDLKDALAENTYDYCVISNNTDLHLQTLNELQVANIPKILVEKPLYLVHQLKNKIAFDYNQVFIGYNLRFLKCVQKLKSVIENQKILTVDVYAGQYLPLWRPDGDYRQHYYGLRNQGGGVIMDFSHEFDYLLYLFGHLSLMYSHFSKESKLEINTEDIFVGHFKSEKCNSLLLRMNYLDKVGKRSLRVNTNEYSIECDLISDSICINGALEKYDNLRNYSYKEMHENILNHNSNSSACTYEEGRKTIELISDIMQGNK